MENRTEEQKIYQDGVSVILGGKEYRVKPLKLRKEREWRQKLAALISTLPQYANVNSDDPEEFGGALNAMMVTMPDQVVDLFFLYAGSLKREEIEEEATGAEVALGFKAVMALAFPLPQALTEAMTKLSQ